MVRSQWVEIILKTWEEKSVIWLTGVRRTGKTTLCKSMTPGGFYDCELPRVRKLLADPEQFFNDLEVDKITLDEIHRLDNASEVLKIAADYFKNIKVIATGSSVLAASKKFKDTLTDRKRIVFLPPLGLQDMQDFKKENLMHRLVFGGLPPYFLQTQFPESAFQEWMDSFWAKDIEEIFKIEKKSAFLKLFELLALQSGGLFEAKSFAAPCGVSHTTIATYINVMQQTHVAYVLRPFHKKLSKEIISAPKVYFFDTGFMTYFKDSNTIHQNDIGFYWEHFVLNEILTFVDRDKIHIWRDKQKHEVDFVIKLRGKSPIAIECKWQQAEFDVKNLIKFREIHSGGMNIVVSSDAVANRTKKIKDLDIMFCSLKNLKSLILKSN